ncbi:MAG: peptide-methionine (S)-S-oxide reductase MsrA [Comamonas sp.]
MMTEVVVFGGGCFWCTEAVFSRVRGVVSVQSGYANGHVDHPSYEQVCTGQTGHAEAVALEYEPGEIGLADLLAIFFATHDPTTPDRQGHDVGPQYRSGVYWTNEAQATAVRAFVAELTAAHAYGDAPIVTELAPLAAFWPAEPEHDRYFERHPYQGYCAMVIAPKVEKFERALGQFLRK